MLPEDLDAVASGFSLSSIFSALASPFSYFLSSSQQFHSGCNSDAGTRPSSYYSSTSSDDYYSDASHSRTPSEASSTTLAPVQEVEEEDGPAPAQLAKAFAMSPKSRHRRGAISLDLSAHDRRTSLNVNLSAKLPSTSPSLSLSLSLPPFLSNIDLAPHETGVECVPKGDLAHLIGVQKSLAELRLDTAEVGRRRGHKGGHRRRASWWDGEGGSGWWDGASGIRWDQEVTTIPEREEQRDAEGGTSEGVNGKRMEVVREDP